MAERSAGATAADIGTLGLFSTVASVFGSNQEKRAAAEATRIINQARVQGITRSSELNAEFSPFITESQGYLGESAAGIRSSQGFLQRLIAQTEDLDTGTGLSDADKIAYEDAAKLLNEQMVSTGNLRSGAAAFGQSQLLRRVVADANQRRFDRQVAKLQLLYGGQQGMAQGANQFQSLAGTAGQIGLYGKQLSTQILQAAMGLAPAQATAEMAKGAALGQQTALVGQSIDKSLEAAGILGGAEKGKYGYS